MVKNKAAVGKCYESAFELLAHLHGDESVMRYKPELWLCHGIARCSKPPHVRMGHAWVEMRLLGIHLVFDAIYPDDPISKEQYYRVGKIESVSVCRYTLAVAMKKQMTTLSQGPWVSHITAAHHVGNA